MNMAQNSQIGQSTIFHGLAVSLAPKRAAEAINAPLKDLARLPQNRLFAPGRKTACHPSHFEGRRNLGCFKGSLNGFYCVFLNNRVLGKDFYA